MNSFFRKVLLLVGGAAGGQLIALALTPVLARLYSPEDFQRVGLLISFGAPAIVVATLKYEAAIIGARTDDEARDLLSLSIVLSLLSAPLLSLIAAGIVVKNVLGYGALGTLGSVAVGMLSASSGVFFALRAYLIRQEQYGQAAQISLLQGVAASAVRLAGGVLHLGFAGLAAGEVVNRTAGVLRGWRTAQPRWLPWHEALRVARAHRQFPRVILPSALIDAVAVALPLPLLTVLTTVGTAGSFSLLQRTLFAVVAVVTAAMADVFQSRYAQLWRAEQGPQAGQYLYRTLGALGLQAGALGVLLYLCAPLALRLFGEQWPQLPAMIRWLIPWLCALYVVGPVSRVVFVHTERASVKLIYDVSVVAFLVCFYALVRSGTVHLADPLLVVAIFSVINAVMYAVYLGVLLSLVHSQQRKV
ncbi:lipopolysaccharide biosynthesis protein [Deinococcus multiflagellatus]|uniref:Lipopolysaccharide biosynthesis protein n=1 Tax=Deinococcus multiflagellatus TaxID=1656887 RepID=A0ABW1ZQB1_9DEIO|nr:hypothetical protein [Deinococcus multiflagellatus]MBZ9714117.1 hypothetical protein [Deinococcus multiflagellatus]